MTKKILHATLRRLISFIFPLSMNEMCIFIKFLRRISLLRGTPASRAELHGDPRQLVQKGAKAPGKHRASMLQDVLAKRLTEVDFMNGAIVQYGKKNGVATPLNQAIWQLIKGLEHSWQDPD